MTDTKDHRTRAGRILTDDDIDAIAREVEETDYDVEALKTRRRGSGQNRSGAASCDRSSRRGRPHDNE